MLEIKQMPFTVQMFLSDIEPEHGGQRWYICSRHATIKGARTRLEYFRNHYRRLSRVVKTEGEEVVIGPEDNVR